MNRKWGEMRKQWLSLVTGVIVSAGLISSAVAAPKHDRDTKKININVKQSDRTRGLERRTKTEKKKDAKPELSADDFIEIQGKVQHINKAVIVQIERLIEDTDEDSSEMPDLLFRLAEARSQQQRYWRFRAMEMYPKIEKSKSKSPLQKKQKSYFNAEKNELLRAIKVYARLTNNPRYKNYPRMDQALFYYAYTLDNAKRDKDAKKIYHQLITNYPNSKYIPQAYLSFADYFFKKNDLDQAENFYNKVLEFPKSSVYSYAMYMKGWVYMNQARHQDALTTFRKTAEITKGKKKYATINKASKKDVVRAYAEVGQAQKALKFFERIDKAYSPKMLRILATIYLDQGQAEKSIYIYRQLISTNPRDEEVCEWQGNVVMAMMTVGNNDQKAEEIENLVKLYKKGEKSKSLKGAKLTECRDNATATTSEMAKIWHNESYKTLNWDTLAYSERLYKVYVEELPKAKDAAEMQYYYADLRWLRAEHEKNPRLGKERWGKTADAFEKVCKSKGLAKSNPDKYYDACLAMLQARKNEQNVDPRVRPEVAELDDKKEKTIPKPRPIPETEKKLLAAFDIYFEMVKDPKSKDFVANKFVKGRTLWKYDHLDDALPIFEDIVDNHNDHETAPWSANIIADSLFRLKRYNEHTKFVDKVLADKTLLASDGDIESKFKERKIFVMRQGAQDYEKKDMHMECGNAYSDIYNMDPEADGMDEVLYNAGLCYNKGNSIGQSIRYFGILNKEYPKSKHSQKALVAMGSAYGAIAYYKQSAEKYEEYATKYSGEKDAPDALQNAVTYRLGIGDDSQATKNIEKFVKNYKRKLKKESSDAMWGLVGIEKKKGNRDRTIDAYKRYMREIGTSGGRDRLLIANAEIGQLLWKQSCKIKTDDGACVKMKRERATRRERKRRRRGNDLPKQCGAASKIKLTVIDRDKRLVKEAQKYFRAALSESKKGGVKNAADDGRKAAAIYWQAASKFHLAEADYEKFLDIEFPKNMDFSDRNQKKAKDSAKRFKKWQDDKLKLGGKTTKDFEEVRQIKGGGAAWAVAAAARIGQVSQNFADGLYTAEIPNSVRTGPYAEDGVDAYCDALTDMAGPLEEKSLSAFDFCLNLSTELNWFNQWSRLCEKELGQIRPDLYPQATEVHTEPKGVATITDTQGLISTIREDD